MKKVLLVGAGDMAISYANVLKDMNVDLTVVGRGLQSSERFYNTTGINCIAGGLDNYVKEHPSPQNDLYVILSVGTEAIMSSLQALVKLNPKRVLIEKPGAISINEIIDRKEDFRSLEGRVFVAYNRRFYSSVDQARKLIAEDGGLTSFNFEFTEWSHTITPLVKSPGVKENWLFANSSHVIDLAFFIGGIPEKMACFSQKAREISWHDNTVFSGAGITKGNILFNYSANWESAGRWGIELHTLKNKYYLKPLEKLFIQKRGEIALNECIFDDSLDIQYKPGLYNQVREFLEDEQGRLLSLEQQIFMAEYVYSKIVNS